MPEIQPIPASERVAAIDIFRGFALFGILAANMRGFNSPAQTYFDPSLMWTGTGDQAVQGVIDLLISGKFITLFSFLFGVGFAVQMERAEARGPGFASVYSRRLLAMLGFALAHALGLWWGDILLPYAVVGFLLLLFRRRTQKTIFIWAQIGLWLPILAMAVFLVLSRFGVPLPSPPKATKELIEQTVRIYSQGSWTEIFTRRLEELRYGYGGAMFFFPKILGMFLLGVYVWRRRILQDLSAHLSLLRKAAWWGFVLGLPANAAALAVMKIWKPDPMAPSGPGLAVGILYTVGMPALSCCYAAVIALLLEDSSWRRRLAPLAPLGRMALTNYLLQSVVATSIFYSYGFGLYGKVSPAAGLVPTFLIFLAQIPLSAWWLRRFQFGPMEWVWRTLTYGKLRSAPTVAAASAAS